MSSRQTNVESSLLDRPQQPVARCRSYLNVAKGSRWSGGQVKWKTQVAAVIPIWTNTIKKLKDGHGSVCLKNCLRHTSCHATAENKQLQINTKRFEITQSLKFIFEFEVLTIKLKGYQLQTPFLRTATQTQGKIETGKARTSKRSLRDSSSLRR